MTTTTSDTKDTKDSNVVEIGSVEEFNRLFTAAKADPSKLVVLYFWAGWHPPCRQLATVLDEVAKDHPAALFLKIEAEKYPDITEQFPVQSVPTNILIKGTVQVVDEGADVPKLVALIGAHAKAKATASQLQLDDDRTDEKKAKAALNERLAKLVRAAPVMLFMKGSPDAPRCGFSREIVEILRAEQTQFGYFDILTDQSVREGLKDYANWRTYPQLYINGDLIGGLDVVKELKSDGQLGGMIPKSSKKEDLNTKLANLIRRERVMIFMKGSPSSPRCGFSAQAVDLLTSAGFQFGHFDILSDPVVREGLKTYSNWPTYPQLYVDGELIGGLDVMKELHQQGELAELAKPKTS